ncbi:Sensor protein KdpD [Hartmannibacter diazotrophicus]|uniref:histidine kinase n=1 Tax=Hartmannibacter diazotrophicus TaxID=1482074 RepID=A0A2C9D298_9HYPH|nr:sensor histidine kinase KdpD [Hartmannibacter diazotrophicus]SON54376.1 Sensor protein KdpD [Hartmannibacter diazotrophicus]
MAPAQTSGEARPEPEALLVEATKEGRGRLKIFLGAAPGVGKTFAMLQAARKRAAEGIDVVVAVVETHGRQDTERLLRNLTVLPREPHFYRGRILQEMDLSAVIARRPQLALIDELAHSNVPDSRHDKRWQDVEEVLSAGIDVYATLNVQHLESLNDIVARVSGVRVRETLPDRVLELADEIELIDLPPEDLIERLRQGKVYLNDQVARAIENFFSKGNLTALRELAMRVAADRVDAQMIAHMKTHAISGPWPTQDRILVCVNESPAAKPLVRAAKRMAERARAPWLAVNIVSGSGESLPDEEKDRITGALRLAETLGAEIASVNAETDIASEILTYARSRNVTRILVGHPRPRRLFAFLTRETVTEAMIRKGHDFEITLIAPDQEEARRAAIRAGRMRIERDPGAYLAATGIVAIATLTAFGIDRLLPVASLSLVFLTGVLVTATRFGLWPSLYAATASFFAYNFFFTVPYFTFEMHRRDDFLTLVLFYAASVLAGNLAARLRSQADAQRAIARRTASLYEFSRRLASAASFDDVVWTAVSNVGAILRCQAVALTPTEGGRLDVSGAFPPLDELDARGHGAALWAFEHGEPAGRATATLPSSDWVFVPLRTAHGTHGVLGITFEDWRSATPDDLRILSALSDQVAIAVERTQLVSDLQDSRLVSETERLRSALLSSVSHDLRTPLVSIIGSASSMIEADEALGSDGRRQLAETIREEGDRLNRYVQNLLDMTRLGYGALKLDRQPGEAREIVGAAANQLGSVLRDHTLVLEVGDDLPAMCVDPVLMQQVFANVLDNAAKYAPDGSAITVAGRIEGDGLMITVSDEGPGIPQEDRERIFDMFYRVRAGDGQRAGTGLGLAICKGIVDVHGGSIRATAARPDGSGTRIEIRLPLMADAKVP